MVKRILNFRVPLGLVHNVAALYGLYCSGYLLALVTVPYLSRVLGPSSWGEVAFVQAFGGYLLLIVEFGFTFSATREVARHQGAKDKLSELVAGVMGAKLLLVALCLAMALGVRHFVLPLREHPALFWAGLFRCLVQGLNVMWFYQGMERMKAAVTIDLLAKSSAVAAIFFLVRGPADSWKVLGIQGAASLLSLAGSLYLVYRDLRFRPPRINLLVGALRGSLTTFVPRNASIMYTVGNAFILGLFAPPHVVGYYAGADRICRAILGLLGPVSDAAYPRISNLAKRSRPETQRFARLAALVLVSIGLLMGLFMFVLAPQLVRVLLGKGFEPAAVVLRVFAILPPIVALRNVLGVHWMLPLDLDRPFNLIVLGAGVLNIGLAVLLAPRHMDVGMAWAATLSQLAAAAATYAILRWMRLDPLSRKPDAAGGDQKDGREAAGSQEPQLEYLLDHVVE